MERVTFTLNGLSRTVTTEPGLMLLEVLRDVLHLPGTKRGCDNGTCGACTVVINGKAVKSCTYPLAKAEGAEILTIEGLAKGGQLHPVQQALVDTDAIQCGFCTPGIVMDLYALFETTPDASSQKVDNVLNRHLCRCTGYETIAEAAHLAQERIKEHIRQTRE